MSPPTREKEITLTGWELSWAARINSLKLQTSPNSLQISSASQGRFLYRTIPVVLHVTVYLLQFTYTSQHCESGLQTALLSAKDLNVFSFYYRHLLLSINYCMVWKWAGRELRIPSQRTSSLILFFSKLKGGVRRIFLKNKISTCAKEIQLNHNLWASTHAWWCVVLFFADKCLSSISPGFHSLSWW